MIWKKYFKTYDGMPERMPASTGTCNGQMQTQNDIAVGLQKSIRINQIVYNDETIRPDGS